MDYKFGNFNMRQVQGLDNTWDAYWYGRVMTQMCQVEIMPSKVPVDGAIFGNKHRVYKVTAENVPLIGHLEQVVRGEDLHEYLESVCRAVNA